MSQFDYINRTCSLSVKRGSRVRYTGSRKAKAVGGVLGTVTSASGAYLMILMDGEKAAQPYHPTWELQVLEDEVAP